MPETSNAYLWLDKEHQVWFLDIICHFPCKKIYRSVFPADEPPTVDRILEDHWIGHYFNTKDNAHA